MAYYGMGDYYRGDYYQGDPGFGLIARAAAPIAGRVARKVVPAVAGIFRRPQRAAVAVGAAAATTQVAAKRIGRPAPPGMKPRAGLAGKIQRLLPGGETGFVPARRRINPANPKALRRALRRIAGFGKLAQRAKRDVQRAATALGVKRGGGKRDGKVWVNPTAARVRVE